MLIKDNFDKATRLSSATNDFLVTHKIPPSPVNYSVVYLYVSRRDEKLTAELDKFLAGSQPLDLVYLEQLFQKYISNAFTIDQEILIPVEKSLSTTTGKINLQIDNNKMVASNLERAGNILAKQDVAEENQHIMTFVMDTLARSQEQHSDLSQELTRACGEVSFLKSKLEKVRQDAIIDSLTGLFNRRGCEEKLKDIDIEQVHSSLAIDIDHFKSINESFGYFIGDKVIQRIAEVIKSTIANNDIAVRYRGEEFLVVMVNKTLAQARDIAESIREGIAKLQLIQKETKKHLPPLTVSIGVAQRQNELSWQELFEQADTALFKAKNSGKNKCVCL